MGVVEAPLDLSQPLTLPCGLKIPNRLAKAALAESWGDNDHLPSQGLIKAYGKWADGGWGIVMTGNVMVDVTHLGQPGDCALNENIPEANTIASWRQWAEDCNKSGTPMIMQLNHPGRQSPIGAGTRGYCAKTIAPSPIALNLGDSLVSRAIRNVVFGTPREMTLDDINHVVARFAETARVAMESGFAGVEIHGAHGYLLAQFMSAKSNQRTDKYGGSAVNRVRIVVEVIEAIRKVVPKSFCVGIKFNSVDHQSDSALADCIEQLQAVTSAGVDFLEVSGGTYEDPVMMLGNEKAKTQPEKSERTLNREAFFLDFAKAIRQHFKDVPLMVTGGFRSRKGMEAALKQGDCDIIGLGRPSVINAAWPKEVILN
ncbi:hypothetical protein Golomagni_07751, partial [Golovinomyces magnicellulatus]